jgi:TolB-like protein/DNA-binding winged helix-turn-helix (wHTH) protein/tetratricopeptide (TPR) repeat protein
VSSPAILRFGSFELDVRSAELRKDGAVVKLAPQPVKLLAMLAQQSGQVVTREEIRRQIWCDGTFVDFDQGLNFCIRQIREALGDDASKPVFVETLPRRGYRFLMPIEGPSVAAPTPAVPRLIVLPFRMLRPDADTDFLAFSLPEAITTSLSGLESLVVRSSMAASRFAGITDLQTLAHDADVDVVLSGSLLRAADQVRVSAQLTEVPAGTLLWSHVTQLRVGDMFQVQDELTRRIVESLSVPLTAHEHRVFKRDVPSSARAYECYLRGNQLSYDSKRWALARDLYVCAVEDDPQFAPAWARLGRMYHVMGKYLEQGGADNFERAEAAFTRALELNPDLAIAHKLYAQLDVDRGRAQKAMERLLGRAHTADSEIFAGLVSACRYCGLLDASIAADARARQLEPRIRTSVAHTYFLHGDHARVATAKLDEVPYVGALSLAAVGRRDDAIAALKELEPKTGTRLREFMIAARTLLEENYTESIAAVRRLLATDFGDPEGLFYLTRHLAHLNEVETALGVFRRVVCGGFVCYPAMARDPWLDPLRRKSEFKELLETARTAYERAREIFDRSEGKI